MDIHRVFQQGAEILAAHDGENTTLHKGHGINEADWELLIQKEYWSPDQARQIRAIIGAVLEVSMTIAGIPAIPMPGQYAAALIAEVVSPCNRFLACTKVPDTFDAVDASGILGTSTVKPMTVQQLMALVIAYSGGSNHEPRAHMLPKEVKETMKQAAKK